MPGHVGVAAAAWENRGVNASTVSARTLVRALLSSGVRDVVLSPGSRSAPLVYAFADAEAALAGTDRALRLHVRIDERDAAFTALGIAKAGRLRGAHRPVAVVTTSGSAVGNLHPAVMEAAHAHLPLVLVTADRPARLRGTGANQTLDAQHAALPEVVAAWDLAVPDAGGCPDWSTAAEAAVTRACASPAGPVQLNTQFDAPLVPDVAGGAAVPLAAEETLVPDVAGGAAAFLGAEGTLGSDGSLGAEGTAGGGEACATLWARVRSVLADPHARPVIVAGDDLGFATRTLGRLAETHAVPVFAEPSSALASHPRTIPAHAQVLGSDSAGGALARITHVVVTGRPTLSRPIARLLDRTDVERVDLPYDADGLATDVLGAEALADGTPRAGGEPHSPADRSAWWAEWNALSRQLQEDGLAAGGDGRTGPQETVDEAVRALLARPGVLVAASSNTVRHLARLQRPHHPARVIASRGLAGIDGLVATASGVALGLEDGDGEVDPSQGTDGGPGEPVRLLVGDLAALHDLGGFVIPRHERRPRLQIIVLHDDGGAIFAGLEHSQPHVADRFDRFFGTPHGVDLAAAARALGMDAQTADATEGRLDDRFRTFLDEGAPGLFQFRLPPVRP